MHMQFFKWEWIKNYQAGNMNSEENDVMYKKEVPVAGWGVGGSFIS